MRTEQSQIENKILEILKKPEHSNFGQFIIDIYQEKYDKEQIL